MCPSKNWGILALLTCASSFPAMAVAQSEAGPADAEDAADRATETSSAGPAAPEAPTGAESSEASGDSRRLTGLLNAGVLFGVPDNLHTRGSQSTLWAGGEVLVMRTHPYVGYGGMLSFGWGGVAPFEPLGKVISLAACGELSTHRGRSSPSAAVTAALGAGFMEPGREEDDSGRKTGNHSRLFASYGATVRQPVGMIEAAGDTALGFYLSVRLEHSLWFSTGDSGGGLAATWVVIGAGLTLFATD